MTDREAKIKFNIYAIENNYQLVKRGEMSMDDAVKRNQKFIDDLTNEEIMNYFKKGKFKSDNTDDSDVPEWVKNELSSSCWEALEYFEII